LKKVHEVSWRMLLPPLLIALIGLEFEFLPAFTDPLLLDAARVISPGAEIGGLVASHPFGTFITAAEVTLAIGLVLFLFWERLHRYLSGLAQLDQYGPAAMFERLLNGLTRLAAWHTKALQHGDLSGYMRLTLSVLLLLGIGGWLAGEANWSAMWQALVSANEQGWALVAAALLIAAGALAAPFIHNRLALLMAVGLVGYGSAVLFLFSGAPDVAFTQFMVETVLVVVAAAVLSRYGEPARYQERRLLNAVIALAAGIGTFMLLAHMFSLPADRSLAEWFAANSLPEAYGRNVVNVILVDFRALDTFGEIAVVAFSALAAWPLLRSMHKRRSQS
jgi:multicomponent Na+:H+ antiporter subunit A